MSTSPISPTPTVRALAALEGGGASGVFNLGNGRPHSVLDVIREVERVTGGGCRTGWRRGARRPGLAVRLERAGARGAGLDPALRDSARFIETAWRWHAAHPQGTPAVLREATADPVHPFPRLLRFAAPYRGRLVAALVAMLLYAAAFGGARVPHQTHLRQRAANRGALGWVAGAIVGVYLLKGLGSYASVS